eukprot:TRINITY_DN193_c4_g1_i1.p1 TRINITY_DN193_c4_g1~~TRINITY_DN193_c4_g1_i1.p1  ORF type:complete len:500 (-),score=105.15 TRINITY_DN193_c4_g1_i1:103-1581(-)
MQAGAHDAAAAAGVLRKPRMSVPAPLAARRQRTAALRLGPGARAKVAPTIKKGVEPAETQGSASASLINEQGHLQQRLKKLTEPKKAAGAASPNLVGARRKARAPRFSLPANKEKPSALHLDLTEEKPPMPPPPEPALSATDIPVSPHAKRATMKRRLDALYSPVHAGDHWNKTAVASEENNICATPPRHKKRKLAFTLTVGTGKQADAKQAPAKPLTPPRARKSGPVFAAEEKPKPTPAPAFPEPPLFPTAPLPPLPPTPQQLPPTPVQATPKRKSASVFASAQSAGHSKSVFAAKQPSTPFTAPRMPQMRTATPFKAPLPTLPKPRPVAPTGSVFANDDAAPNTAPAPAPVAAPAPALEVAPAPKAAPAPDDTPAPLEEAPAPAAVAAAEADLSAPKSPERRSSIELPTSSTKKRMYTPRTMPRTSIGAAEDPSLSATKKALFRPRLAAGDRKRGNQLPASAVARKRKSTVAVFSGFAASFKKPAPSFDR